MRTIARVLLIIIVLALIAYAAADFILSGNKFTWPPPAQLSWSSLQNTATNTVTPPAPTPATPTPPAPTPPSPTPPTPTPPAPTPPAPTPPAPTPPAPTPPQHAQAPTCPDGTTAASFVDGQSAYYCAPGHLVPSSGTGDADGTIWAPNMRFPIDAAPAFANSQVWGVGGTSGPAGGQGDTRNYSYPWRDDFCEARGYATAMCPTGTGHQGQDIRPAACCDSGSHLWQDHFVVDAAEDGTITSIGTYTVYLTADSGRLYRYLHMDMKKLKVKEGDTVTRGQPIGYVSNNFGNSVTTFHLHFEIKEAVTKDGKTLYTWVPPYSSLVAAYSNLLKGTP